MIGHDDESAEEERMTFLNEVQCFDCFSGAGGIGEDRLATESIRRHQHHVLMSDGVPLEHGAILQAPRVDTRSPN